MLLIIRRQQKKLTRRAAASVRDKWVTDVENLISEAERWANEEPSWTVTRGEKEIEEEKLGKYRVSTLKVQADRDEVHLEPIARYSWRGDGQINFSSFPTLYSVRLLRDEASGNWIIRTDSGIDWPSAWSREIFLDVAKRLLTAP